MNKHVAVLVGGAILLAALVIMFAAPFPQTRIPRAEAQQPFGGMVTYIFYCDGGAYLLLNESTQAGVIPGAYMWIYGNLPYERYVPPHTGQWLLGKWSGVALCSVSGEVITSAPMIIWHGEGI
jgi:hypothetical protein